MVTLPKSHLSQVHRVSGRQSASQWGRKSFGPTPPQRPCCMELQGVGVWKRKVAPSRILKPRWAHKAQYSGGSWGGPTGASHPTSYLLSPTPMLLLMGDSRDSLPLCPLPVPALGTGRGPADQRGWSWVPRGSYFPSLVLGVPPHPWVALGSCHTF